MPHNKQQTHSVILFVALVVVSFSSCIEEDTIPSTPPSGPFSSSQIIIGKNTVPAAGSILTRGRTEPFALHIAGTLSSGDKALLGNISLVIAFGAIIPQPNNTLDTVFVPPIFTRPLHADVFTENYTSTHSLPNPGRAYFLVAFTYFQVGSNFIEQDGKALWLVQ